MTLVVLDVTPRDTVRAPWADRDLPETCQSVISTGKPCPSCGITRSLVSAAHGDLDRSRHFHTAGVPILAMLLAQCAMRLAFLSPRLRSAPLDIVASAGMLIAFAVMLNA